MRARRKGQKGADQVLCCADLQCWNRLWGRSVTSLRAITAAVLCRRAGCIYNPNPCFMFDCQALDLEPCMLSPDCCMIQRHLALSVSPTRSVPDLQIKLSPTCDSLLRPMTR